MKEQRDQGEWGYRGYKDSRASLDQVPPCQLLLSFFRADKSQQELSELAGTIQMVIHFQGAAAKCHAPSALGLTSTARAS